MFSLLMNTPLYEHIGKLFYAVAKIDGAMAFEEFRTFNRIIERDWKDHNTKAVNYMRTTFSDLQAENKAPKKCFDEFINFLKAHPEVFSDNLKTLILKTANKIAYAFAGINKSELHLIATLDIEFKKTNTTDEK
jgi:hypothetical protein